MSPTIPAAHPRAHLCLIIPAVVFVVSFLGVLVLISGGWFGPEGQAGLAYCEASRTGWIKQPANTWSNLGFVVAGLAVAVQAWRGHRGGTSTAPLNRMTSGIFYPTLYASVVVFIGPGSMALHATTAEWGGKLDVLSMYLWAAFALVYALARWRELDRRSFTILYGVVSALLAVHLLIDFPPVSGTLVFAAVLVAYAGIEMRVVRGNRESVYDVRWLCGAVAAFFIAFSIWLLSGTDGPLCDPESLVQGHAVWHLLDAAATFAFYRYFRSESRPRLG